MEPNELIQEAAISDNPDEVPVVPVQVQNKKKRFFVIAIIVVFLLLITVSVGLYLKNVSPKKTIEVRSATSTPTPSISSTIAITNKNTTTPSIPKPTVTPIPSTALLNSYSNRSLEVMFQYPPGYEITENSSNPTQSTVTLSLDDTYIRFDRFAADYENEAPYNQTNITEVHNGVTWKVVTSGKEDSTCQSTDCIRTPTYYMYKDGYRYSFTYSPDSIKNVVEDLLSSFSFFEFVAQ